MSCIKLKTIVFYNNWLPKYIFHAIFTENTYNTNLMSDILSINISDIVPWSFDWTTLTPRQQGLKIPEIGSHDSWSPPPNPVPMETRTVYWWHFPLPLIHSLKNWRGFLQTTEEKMKYFKFQRRFFDQALFYVR